MTLKKEDKTELRIKREQKEITDGILKAIAEISEETEWPEGADAFDVQMIITQLARSAAHLRDSNRMNEERFSK